MTCFCYVISDIVVLSRHCFHTGAVNLVFSHVWALTLNLPRPFSLTLAACSNTAAVLPLPAGPSAARATHCAASVRRLVHLAP